MQGTLFTFCHVAQEKGGLGMFKKYSAMSMEERDVIVEEWAKATFSTSVS